MERLPLLSYSRDKLKWIVFQWQRISRKIRRVLRRDGECEVVVGSGRIPVNFAHAETKSRRLKLFKGYETTDRLGRIDKYTVLKGTYML